GRTRRSRSAGASGRRRRIPNVRARRRYASRRCRAASVPEQRRESARQAERGVASVSYKYLYWATMQVLGGDSDVTRTRTQATRGNSGWALRADYSPRKRGTTTVE